MYTISNIFFYKDNHLTLFIIAASVVLDPMAIMAVKIYIIPFGCCDTALYRLLLFEQPKINYSPKQLKNSLSKSFYSTGKH